MAFPGHPFARRLGNERMRRRRSETWAARRLRGIVATAACFVLTTSTQAAEVVPGLYSSTVFVTGQGEETRGPGIAKAFAAVLVKVSGDPRLATDPRVAALAASAAGFVDAISYRDRMEGIPVHDEQGSRDRPYDLTVAFAPDQVDDALRGLGGTPWDGPRPELLVVVAVANGDTRFVLAADGAKGRDMREAMAAAAGQYGMPVALPGEVALVDGGMATNPEGLHQAPLDDLTRDSGADVAVSGTLVWSDADLGWDADWQMTAGGVPYRWRAHRVSFDDAFRSAIGGAAQILSGHGAPN